MNGKRDEGSRRHRRRRAAWASRCSSISSSTAIRSPPAISTTSNATRRARRAPTIAATPAEVGKAPRLRHHRRRLRRRGQRGDARRRTACWRDAPGSIIAVSSTATPDNVKALDEKARAKGIDMLDAPICRGRFAADEGTLLALVGGKPDVVERGARRSTARFCSDYRASRRRRPRPGRQGDEQPAALDQRHRPDRGRQARRPRPASISSSCATRC